MIIIKEDIENINEVTNEENQDIKFNFTKEKINKQSCKVLLIKNNKLIVNFQGYGVEIILDDTFDKENIKDNIIVKYKSTIGKSDFQAFI